MASIRMKRVKLVTVGDEVEEVEREELIQYEPPICNVCNQYTRNIQTINGVRRFQCVTHGCTNRRFYSLDEGRFNER